MDVGRPEAKVHAVITRVHDASLRVDALWVPPSALLRACSLPRLPKLAKLCHNLPPNPLNALLALADTGARCSEHGRGPANATVVLHTVLVVTLLPLCSSPLAHSSRVSYVSFPLSL